MTNGTTIEAVTITSIDVFSEILKRSIGLALAAGDHRRDGRDRLVYFPREVFFGRFGFAGIFFSVWGSDFSRFLPATSGSFSVCACSRVTR